MPRTAVGAGASRAFLRCKRLSPRSISGLILLLDPTDASTITLNGPADVAAWANLLGAPHLTQATPADQPSWTLTGGVLFDAANTEFMISTLVSASNSHTLVYRQNLTNTASSQYTIATMKFIYIAVYSGNVAAYDGTAVRSFAAATTGWQTISYVTSAAGLTISAWRNGVSLGASQVYDGTGAMDSTFTLGKNAVASVGHLNGAIKRLALYDRALLNSERAIVEGWVSAV